MANKALDLGYNLLLEKPISDSKEELKKNWKIRNIWNCDMPKYYKYKVFGYYLYYTSFCIIECMHVHASDSKLSESGSAKFFVKIHYLEMYEIWKSDSENGFYGK